MVIGLETIDSYINAFKIKYNYLDKLFNGKLDSSRCNIDTANIFINFESLYYSMRSTSMEKKISTLTKKELKAIYRQSISAFINVAAHYRAYFTRNKIKTNIVYFYNSIPDEYGGYNNSTLCETYRDHFVESLNNTNRINCNNWAREIMPLFKTICEYIENVYVIECNKKVESSMIPMVLDMDTSLPSNLNIVVTKDLYDFQYVNLDWLIISKHQTEPVLLTKKNVIKYLCWKNDIDENEAESTTVSSKLLPFIISCLGDRKRSIPKLKGVGFKAIYKSLKKLYETGFIFNEDETTFDISNLISVLNDKTILYTKNTEMGNLIMRNFKVIDLSSQYRILNKAQKNKILEQVSDKTDIDALIEISNKYFADYPLMLIELSQYKKKPKIEDDLPF